MQPWPFAPSSQKEKQTASCLPQMHWPLQRFTVLQEPQPESPPPEQPCESSCLSPRLKYTAVVTPPDWSPFRWRRKMASGLRTAQVVAV
jgi:hypothetical protein